MATNSEINEIRKNIKNLTEKLEALLNERDTKNAMNLSEKSISKLYKDEPNLYTINDLKIRYR